MIENDNKVTRLVTFRVDEPLAAAMRKAASRQYSSVSDVIRQSVVESMRRRGLLTDESR
jgi:Arc/MetJ-type ribon-helix-helix transcriptional regulator